MFNFQGSLTLLSTLVTISCATSTCNGNINRNGIQKLYHDRCISGEIIGDAHELSLLGCVENCIRTKGCASFQYSRALFRCLKSSKNISTDIPKEVCRGEVSSAREDWTEGFPDPCQSAACLTGAICIFDLHGNVSTCEVPGTCELPLLNRLNGQNILDDCDAYEGRKVRFMSKKTLQKLVSLDNVCTFREEIVVRLRMSNTQKEVVLAEHFNYSRKHNLTYLLNDHQGFHAPQTEIIPYFYLGFLPISTANDNTTQGYRANGKDFSFHNCDANSNSYIVFYAGEQIINRTINGQNEFMMGWIEQASLVRAERYLPNDYFMQFEMHMGGCGGLMRSHDTGHPEINAAVGCIIELFYAYALSDDMLLPISNVDTWRYLDASKLPEAKRPNAAKPYSADVDAVDPVSAIHCWSSSFRRPNFMGSCTLDTRASSLEAGSSSDTVINDKSMDKNPDSYFDYDSD